MRTDETSREKVSPEESRLKDWAPGCSYVKRLGRWRGFKTSAGELIWAEVWGWKPWLFLSFWIPRGKMMDCIRALLLLRHFMSFCSVPTSDIFHQGTFYIMGGGKDLEDPISYSRRNLSRKLPEYWWEVVSSVLLSSSKRMYLIKGGIRIN